MKRSGTPGGSAGPKRARGGGGDGEEGGGSQTFEEELMMMDDENMGDEHIDMDDAEDALIQVKRWSRPPAGAFDPKQNSLAFHWVDIDITSGSPLEKNPCAGAKTIGSKEAIVPIIRLYGSTKDGSSVLTYVHGFTSYFYVALPPSTNLSDGARAQIRAHLDQKVCIIILACIECIFCSFLSVSLRVHCHLSGLVLIFLFSPNRCSTSHAIHHDLKS